MNRIKSLRSALLAVLLGASLPAGASAAGSISGHVAKASDGSNVAFYTVDLFDATGKVKQDSECTDAAGDYLFSAVAAGNHFVRFSGDASCAGGHQGLAAVWYPNWGRQTLADPVPVTDGQTATANGSLGVSAVIAGTLTDADTAGNLQNISAQAVDADGNIASTGCSAANGSYAIDGLGGIGYVVRFIAGGCGAVAAYPTRYYKTGAPNGVLANAAEFLATDTGQTKTLANVALSSSQFALSVNTFGSGSVTSSAGGINCPGLCTATFATGTAVTLTPTPSSGQKFTGWTGDCTGTGACSLPMTADHSVGASFAVNNDPAPTTPSPTTPAPTTPAPTTPAPGSPTPTTPAATTPTKTATPTPTPTGSIPTPSGGGPAPKTRCSVAAPSKVKSGRFTVKVTCDRSAKLSLGGNLTFKTKVKGKSKTTTVKLKSSKATTAAKTTVTFKLPKSALAALKAKVKIAGTLKLSVVDSAGAGTVSSKIAKLK